MLLCDTQGSASVLRKSSYRIPEYLIASDVAISLGQVEEVGRPRITRGDGGDTKQSENAVLHIFAASTVLYVPVLKKTF